MFKIINGKQVDVSPKLLLSDNRGTYIPADFIESFRIAGYNGLPVDAPEAWQGINAEDATDCANPDSEWYWEAWETILSNAFYVDANGTEWTLYQNGDLWAVAYKEMTEKEKAEFFEGYEPLDEDEEND